MHNTQLKIIGIVNLVLFIALLLCAAFLPQKTIDTAVAKIQEPIAALIPKKPSLESLLKEELDKMNGEYAISVKHLKTGETYNLKGDISFETASLYKIWVMAAVYEQIENGKLKKEQVLSRDAKDLNERFKIASEEAEIKEGEIKYTVEQALEKMITISDNYAAYLLSDRIGPVTVATYLKKNGFTKSSFGSPPKTTPNDMVLFFEKLYKGELASEEITQDMITLLQRQQLNYLIPKYLPEDTTIAHKTGRFNNVAHDAGIVYTEDGEYIVAILTKTKNTSTAEENGAQISEIVFDYFKNK